MMFPSTLAQQQATIPDTWTIFKIDQDAPISLRAIWPKGLPASKPVKNITFNAATYPNLVDRQKAFEEAAIRLNRLGYNIYIVMNPIDPAFAGDEHNGLAVKDADIKCRRLLLVDIDRAVTNQPATDEELNDIVCFGCNNIEKLYFVDNDLEPMSVCSGNGMHIYFSLDDMPNDEDAKSDCRNFLLRLARQHDTADIKIDTSVYNASRITKVLGTVARKGLETEDREYRMASIIE
jgi:hypothetical protein